MRIHFTVDKIKRTIFKFFIQNVHLTMSLPFNCSSVLQCQALAFNIHQLLPLYIVISGISLFGMICNLLSFLALIKCTCEFNQFLTVFTLNSFFLNTHYFLSHLLRATSATDSFGFWFFSLTIYFPLAPICFTLGGLLVNFLLLEYF